MKATRNQRAMPISIHILIVFTSLRESPCINKNDYFKDLMFEVGSILSLIGGSKVWPFSKHVFGVEMLEELIILKVRCVFIWEWLVEEYKRAFFHMKSKLRISTIAYSTFRAKTTKLADCLSSILLVLLKIYIHIWTRNNLFYCP